MYRVIRLFAMVAVFCFATNAGSADDRNTDVIIGVNGKRVSLPKDENGCIRIGKAEIDERNQHFPFLGDSLEIKVDDFGETPMLIDVMCLKEDGEYRAVKVKALLNGSTIQIIKEPLEDLRGLCVASEYGLCYDSKILHKTFSTILLSERSPEYKKSIVEFVQHRERPLGDFRQWMKNVYPDAPRVLTDLCCAAHIERARESYMERLQCNEGNYGNAQACGRMLTNLLAID